MDAIEEITEESPVDYISEQIYERECRIDSLHGEVAQLKDLELRVERIAQERAEAAFEAAVDADWNELCEAERAADSEVA